MASQNTTRPQSPHLPYHRDRVKEVFRAAQAFKHHEDLVNQMKNLRASTEGEEQFRQDFIWCLKHVMVVYERSPNVERVIDFAAKFAVAAEDDAGPQNGNISISEDNQSAVNEFLKFLFNFLLESYEANDKAVRFRVCQLINKLLNQMGDDASIDDDMADQIYDCMLVRVRDKFPNVRTQAIAALARLQDPQDLECPVISSYLQIMQIDKSAEVRRAALINVAVSAQTLPFIIERTRDITDSVRKQAYRILAEKVNIRAFTIAQRLQLLQNGLSDKSEEVKKSARSLMKSWLASLDSQVIKFLNCLHVETSGNTPEIVLDAMFKDVSKETLQEHIIALREHSKESGVVDIGYDDLSCEISLYWRYLTQNIKKRWKGCDDLLDQLIPELSVFCKYIKGFVDNNITNRSEDDEKEQQVTFNLRQLLLLTAVFDLSDEVGRKELCGLIRSLLVNEALPLSIVSVLIDRYRDVQPDEESRIQELVEIISDIRQPITVDETPQIIEERRKREVKMASIRVKLNQYREELQESVEKQDFARASVLKQLLSSFEKERDELQEEEERSLSNSIREEKDDPWTLERCLTISCEMLKGIRNSGLSSTLRTLAETLFVASGIQNENPQVRNIAVLCLGMVALQNLEFARQFLVLFLQVAQIDVELVRVNALKVVFDLLLLFGFDTLMGRDSLQEETGDHLNELNDEKETHSEPQGEDVENGTDKEQAVKKSARWVLSFLTSLLDNESVPLRQIAADGMAHLLLAGRIRSSKLLSRLVLLWCSPVTDDDCRIRHCLGVFLPTFASASRVNQELIEEAFLPTLKTIFDAPVDSPLSSINANDVASLFVQLCDSNNLETTAKKSSINNTYSTIHISLALKIANEILSDPDGPYVKVLCKTLTLLNLSGCDLPNVNDLKVLLDQLLENVDDDVALKSLRKFHGILELLDTSAPEDETEEKKEIQASDGESNNGGEGNNEEKTSYETATNLTNGETINGGDCTSTEATANEKEDKNVTGEDNNRQPLTDGTEEMKEKQTSDGGSNSDGKENISYETATNLTNGETINGGNCTSTEATADEKEDKNMTVEDNNRQPLTEKGTNSDTVESPCVKTKSKARKQKKSTRTLTNSSIDTPALRTRSSTRRNKSSSISSNLAATTFLDDCDDEDV